ncbi:MAG: 2Fe-2S iron-sulfur cluster-binding protein [Pelolinea sp.]|nr:2Fe-2S iron-sulfur cluster-binding protein [Pelolinea sp.]
MVKITIDGKITEVKKGTTVLNAARELGIEIPTLCDHPELTPYGGCRMCLVEVEGARTLQPSCTLPASNEMVVKTDTKKVHDARKFILSMIFSERNHFCMYCQVSGGDCELQNSAYDEGMTHWPIMPNWQPYPVDASHPFIILEHNRCILCRSCVRACGELVGNFTLGFEERGANSNLVADLGLPLGESSCVGCGTCLEVCPTGALIDRWSAYQGKETEVDATKTICLGCSIGCGINALTRDNRLVRIEGDWDAEINHGIICKVGRFIPMTEERERILTPMVRVDGKLKASTWENALSAAAAKIEKGNISGVASTRLSMEALNNFKAICDAFDAKSISSTEESAAVDAVFDYAASSGKPFESKIDEIKDADCFLILGEDTTKDHQVISFFAKRQIPAGAKVIQISDKSTGYDNFANESLMIEKKSQAAFLNSLEILVSGGTEDLNKTAKSFDLDAASLQNVVDALTTSDKVAIIFGSRYDFDDADAAVKSVVSLNNKLNGKLITTKGNINSVGASSLGINISVSHESADVVILALGDEELSQSFSKKFESTPFSIVFSSYVSHLTASADIVFPVQNWLEQDGHFVNADGHILEAKAVLSAPDSVYSSEDSLSKLADALKINKQSDWKKLVKETPAPVLIS